MKSNVSFNHRVIRLACASALGVSALFSASSHAASMNGDATATVMIPISIAQVAPLAFGKFARGATGGTVTMTTGGVRSSSGDVVLSLATGGTAGSFTVTGEPSTTYTITVPSGTATLTGGAGGTDTMSVGTFSSNPSASGTIAVGGTQTVAVGAVLTVGASQSPGAYAGTYPMIVEYN